jgi:hypothetical protein
LSAGHPEERAHLFDDNGANLLVLDDSFAALITGAVDGLCEVGEAVRTRGGEDAPRPRPEVLSAALHELYPDR